MFKKIHIKNILFFKEKALPLCPQRKELFHVEQF